MTFPLSLRTQPSPTLTARSFLPALAVLAGCEAGTADGGAVVPSEAVVTYSFVVSAPSAELAPSSPLVAEIAEDPNLGRLTVRADSVGRRLSVEFAFGSVAAFRTWRAEVGPLVDRAAALSEDTVAFSPRLSVRRPALYRSLLGNLADSGDLPPINVTYQTSENEAGGDGTGEGVGDAGDIDAVTLICNPGVAGTIEECTVSN